MEYGGKLGSSKRGACERREASIIIGLVLLKGCCKNGAGKALQPQRLLPCPPTSQIGSSTNIRTTMKHSFMYQCNHVHASQTSQGVLSAHHFDHDPVIIANQTITQGHPIHSAACNAFFASSAPYAHVLRRAAESWTLQTGFTSNGEVNPSSSTRITEAHLPSS